jgi:hypothetical protein
MEEFQDMIGFGELLRSHNRKFKSQCDSTPSIQR